MSIFFFVFSVFFDPLTQDKHQKNFFLHLAWFSCHSSPQIFWQYLNSSARSIAASLLTLSIIIQKLKFADTWAIKKFEIFSLHFLSCPDQSVIASYMILKTDKIAELDNIEGLSTGEWVWIVECKVALLSSNARSGSQATISLSRTHRHSILSLHCIHDLYRLNKTPIISGRKKTVLIFQNNSFNCLQAWGRP